MKSPFPGMDPYLEQSWRDVHAALIIYSRDQLQDQLPGDLYARVEERIVLESGEALHQARYPDVRVVEYPRGGLASSTSSRRPSTWIAGNGLPQAQGSGLTVILSPRS